MEKFKDWETMEAKGINDFISLKPGAYVCKILDAREYQSESGNKSLQVSVDICDGEFKDYFRNLYENNTNEDKKWDNNAVKYLGLGEKSQPFFKGFITVVQNSNKGYEWNWDETTLKGKKVVGIFRQEEYIKQDGSIGIKVRIDSFRSLDKLNDIKIPKVKTIDGAYVDYETYKANYTTDSVQNNNAPEIKDNDLPFEI